MVIKKVEFTNLNSTKAYLSIGGIRFYDGDGNLIPSGNIISSTALIGESDNFIATASSRWSNGTYYYALDSFNTSRKQTGNYQDYSYWMASTNTNQQLSVEFKISIETISKIEFVPRPDVMTDREVSSDFDISLYDENNSLLKKFTVTPIIGDNIIQTLELYTNKILISLSDGNSLSVKETILTSNNLVPIMSSSTNGIVSITESASYNTGTVGWKAFDREISSSNGWYINGSAIPSEGSHWLKVNFGEVKSVRGISLACMTSAGSVKDFVIQGSNDNTAWDNIYSGVNLNYDTTKSYFDFNKTFKYKIFRILIISSHYTSNPKTYCGISEMEFFTSETSAKLLSSQSEQNFISHGMDKSTELDLSTEIKNKVFIEQSPTILGSGKVFKKTIDTTKTPIKKVSIE